MALRLIEAGLNLVLVAQSQAVLAQMVKDLRDRDGIEVCPVVRDWAMKSKAYRATRIFIKAVGLLAGAINLDGRGWRSWAM